MIVSPRPQTGPTVQNVRVAWFFQQARIQSAERPTFSARYSSSAPSATLLPPDGAAPKKTCSVVSRLSRGSTPNAARNSMFVTCTPSR